MLVWPGLLARLGSVCFGEGGFSIYRGYLAISLPMDSILFDFSIEGSRSRSESDSGSFFSSIGLFDLTELARASLVVA